MDAKVDEWEALYRRMLAENACSDDARC